MLTPAVPAIGDGELQRVRRVVKTPSRGVANPVDQRCSIGLATVQIGVLDHKGSEPHIFAGSRCAHQVQKCLMTWIPDTEGLINLLVAYYLPQYDRTPEDLA